MDKVITNFENLKDSSKKAYKPLKHVPEMDNETIYDGIKSRVVELSNRAINGEIVEKLLEIELSDGELKIIMKFD